MYLAMFNAQRVTSSVIQGLLGRQLLRNGSWCLYVTEYFTSLKGDPKSPSYMHTDEHTPSTR